MEWRRSKMKLKDLEMMPTEIPNGVQAILQFGDNYQLSIVQSDFSYGGKQGKYEIGVFKNGDMTEMPGITEAGDTIKGFLSEDDVNAIIKKMHLVSGADPIQI